LRIIIGAQGIARQVKVFSASLCGAV